MSKDRMNQQTSRDMAQSHRGGNEGISPKRTGEKNKDRARPQGATTKRGSTSRA